MNLQEMQRRRNALDELAGSEDALRERTTALENVIREKDSKDPALYPVLSAAVWERGAYVMGRLLAAKTDDKVFYKVRRSKETEDRRARCMAPTERRETVTRENHRDIAVAGLGLVTVSRTHTDLNWRTESGKVKETDHSSKYRAHFKLPDLKASAMVGVLASDGESWNNGWPLHTILDFDEPEAAPWELAERIESIGSIEHIASVVGVELEECIFTLD